MEEVKSLQMLGIEPFLEVKSLQVLGIEPFLEPVLATEPPSITVQPYQGFILRNCQAGGKVDG